VTSAGDLYRATRAVDAGSTAPVDAPDGAWAAL
jgi:hypothetical protein